jgi:pSer/pThr/pTyr-binding forkhead associated (FHA) protein
MDLYLKITSGPRANDIFKLQPSITIGRSKSDINLKDSKASTMHGKITEEEGALYYLDLNSTNGSYVAGAEVKKIKLVPGLVITIGGSTLEVATEFDIKKNSTVLLSEWRENLFNFVRDLEIDQTSNPVVPFSKCLRVEVKTGAQAGMEWILGYGPRKIGRMSSDLCLLDDSLGDFCLKIHQRGNDVLIDSIGTSFLVHGQKKNTEILKDRLSIQIGDTLLEIGFLE